VGTRRLGHPGELGDGGDITDEDTTGGQCAGDDIEALPGRQHVQDDPVDGARLDGLRQGFDQVADGDPPGWVRTAEEALDVASRDVGEVLAAFEGVQVPLVAHGPQERHAQRPRAHAGFDHVGAGEDVGHGHDLTGVLGVDHSRAAGHGEHVVAEQRTDRQVLDAGGVLHGRAVRGADEVVVGQPAAVRVEVLARHEGDRVKSALGVGQLNALTLGELSAA